MISWNAQYWNFQRLQDSAKALVTGATGFVGAAVTRKLLAQGYVVRTMARAGSDRQNLAGLDVEIVTGDLQDAQSLTKAAQGVQLVQKDNMV